MSGRKGFQNISPERHREICSKGGKEAHRQGKAHQFTSEEAKIAGAKGGRATAAKNGGPKAIDNDVG